MRLTQDQLRAIMEKEGCVRLWSWSKWNCFHNSKYEYYLKYIRHLAEDRDNSIYTTTGGLAHDVLEKFYTGEIPYEQMTEYFEDGWITAFDIAELKFDRNDEAHNQAIAGNYHDNLTHFFQHHVPVKGKIAIERFVKIVLEDQLFQGYIDACYKDDDGNIHIVDFKTSSIYTGKKAEKESGQLILYTMGIMQQGIPLDKIRAEWNFLKYCSIQYEQANGQVKTRIVERSKIGESLQANAKTWLKKLGFADRLDEYSKALLDANDISVLPELVQKKYAFSDAVVGIELSGKIIEQWRTVILTQIRDILLRESDYFSMKKKGIDELTCSKQFWDSEEEVRAQSYYYSTLCGYSPSLLLPYKEYLDKLERQKQGEDLFNGLSGANEINSNKVTISDGEVDLSWLDNI